MRAVLRSRLAVPRRFNSTSTPSPMQNPQVKKAVEGAQRMYQQGADVVKRVAGPVGDRVAGAFGGEKSDPICLRRPSSFSTAQTPRPDGLRSKLVVNVGWSLMTVTGYQEPLVYNARTVSSLLRQVYQTERLAPPLNIGTWASAYGQLLARGTNINFWREAVTNGQWAVVAIGVGDRLSPEG